MLSRRKVLAGAGLLGVTSAASCGAARAQQTSGAPLRTLHAHVDRNFLAYEGAIPGPLLRLRQGEELHLRLFNELDEPTSLHCHGVRGPNAMDGVPDLTQMPVAPGGSFDYRFRPPDAGTFWYHAHSAEQLDQGLHGALIVDEQEAVDVDRDVALVLGMPDPTQPSAREPALVNGAVRPDIAVRPGLLRFSAVFATKPRSRALSLRQRARPRQRASDHSRCPCQPILCPRASTFEMRSGSTCLWAKIPRKGKLPHFTFQRRRSLP